MYSRRNGFATNALHFFRRFDSEQFERADELEFDKAAELLAQASACACHISAE